ANYLDELWNASRGWYEDDNGYGSQPYTLLNASMLEVIAIQAGHGRASLEDIARAHTVIGKLLSTPAYDHYSWHAIMDGSNYFHEAIDQPTAEALFFSWKYRSQLGLDPGTIATIREVLTLNRPVPIYAGHNLSVDNLLENQSLAKWLLNRL